MEECIGGYKKKKNQVFHAQRCVHQIGNRGNKREKDEKRADWTWKEGAREKVMEIKARTIGSPGASQKRNKGQIS